MMKMKAFGIGLLVVAVLVVGLLIGYLLRGPTWELPQAFSTDKYDVLKDTLIIVLTFAAITIAVLGVAVYVIVSQRLERETGKQIANESKRWIVWLASLTGNKFWEMDKRDQAIKLTEEAYGYAQELDEKELKNQQLIGEIRNNLASYYVETRQKADIAQGFAAYIHNISHKFPKQRAAWEDTYRKVFEAFPEQK